MAMLGNLLGKFTGGGATAPADPAPRPRGAVEIEGRPYQLESWSYTGFLAADYDGALAAGDHVPVRCLLKLGNRRFKVQCKAKLVRIDAQSRKLVGAFVDMPAAARAKMVRIFGGLLPD